MREVDPGYLSNATVRTTRLSEAVTKTASGACEVSVPAGSLGALRIPEVCRLTGFGRTTIYAAIKAGDLIARRYGRRTIVLEDDLQRFLRGLPTI